jgi:GTP cyclohydrolase II
MPFFFSDLFEFGYEAVGDCDSKLQTVPDWVEENRTGVVYYLNEGRVRGVMTCGIFGKTDEAREVIRKAQPASPKDLTGKIRP